MTTEPELVSSRSARKYRVLILGGVLLVSVVLVAACGEETLDSLNASVRSVELFDWVTDSDPAVHGHGDHIVGADADDPDFKLSDLEYDSPNERMIPGAAETRCPMCPGTDEYYRVEKSFRSGRLAQKATSMDDRISPLPKERGRNTQATLEPNSDVDSPSQAMQVLLRKVIEDIRQESEVYARVDGQRLKTEAQVQRLERQQAGLATEEADVQAQLSSISGQQADLIQGLQTQPQSNDEPSEALPA